MSALSCGIIPTWLEVTYDPLHHEGVEHEALRALEHALIQRRPQPIIVDTMLLKEAHGRRTLRIFYV